MKPVSATPITQLLFKPEGDQGLRSSRPRVRIWPPAPAAAPTPAPMAAPFTPPVIAPMMAPNAVPPSDKFSSSSIGSNSVARLDVGWVRIQSETLAIYRYGFQIKYSLCLQAAC